LTIAHTETQKYNRPRAPLANARIARGRYAFLDLTAGAFAWKRDEPDVVAVNTATLLPRVSELFCNLPVETRG